MNSLFRQTRGIRTLLIGILLMGMYGTYALLTRPLLHVDRAESAARGPRSQKPQQRTAEFRKPAETWFREDPWVAEAGKQFRDGGRILYARELLLQDDDHTVKVEPVAVLWELEGEDVPVTMTAASAKIESSSPLTQNSASFGRITRGALQGDVRIRGPHGLRIDGHNFNISDDSLRIFSSAPVMFAWEGHTAVAQDGIEIQLLPSQEDDDQGLMSVSNVQWIRLNGRVQCDLMLQDKDKKREATHLKIDARNGFEFFVPTHTATFMGPRTQRPSVENQILIERPLPSGMVDTLRCSQLTLQLRPEIRPDGKAAASPGQLELDTIRAEGSRALPVIFQSEQENVIATMTNLLYRLDQRLMELQNTFTDAEGRPYPVRIQQETSELLSPWILVYLADGGKLQSLECRGPGVIRHPEEDVQESLSAAWSESFSFLNGEQPKLIFRKGVQIAQPERQFRMSGELVEVELENRDPGIIPGSSDQAPNAQRSNSPQAESGSFALGGLKPKRILATQNVELFGEQISGKAREQMVVNFTNDNVSGGNGQSPVVVSPVSAGGVFGGGSGEPGAARGFTHFDADTLEAYMVAGGGSETGRLSNIWLKGNISVDHTAADTNQSFNATGNVLRADTGFQAEQQISLFGDPAVVVSTTRRIEGQRIDIDPRQREVTVEGSGRIRLVSDRDFQGRPLRKPSPLDIYWGDRMSFAGRTASFRGKIRAVMNDGESHDMELKCAGMLIHFSDDLALTQTGAGNSFEARTNTSNSPVSNESAQKRPGIRQIECESLVEVRIDQLVAGNIDAQHEARFSDLVVNLHTGEFTANGPGWIRSTQPDRGNRMKVAPGIMARANTPVRTSETAFVYVDTEFIGNLSGNLNDRIVRLKQHVTGVFGPVRHLGERINISTVSTADLPPRTGILRCEELTIAAVSTPVSDETSFTLEADRNARLESQQLSGDADKITYDHVKEQFILRATRESPATVFHRPGARGEVRSLVGQRFEYYPTRDHLVANEIIGVQASQ